jgi:hypothetical protein
MSRFYDKLMAQAVIPPDEQGSLRTIAILAAAIEISTAGRTLPRRGAPIKSTKCAFVPEIRTNETKQIQAILLGFICSYLFLFGWPGRTRRLARYPLA